MNLIYHENNEKCRFYSMISSFNLNKYRGVGSEKNVTSIKKAFLNQNFGGPIIGTNSAFETG